MGSSPIKCNLTNMLENLLLLILLFPIFGILLLLINSSSKKKLLKIISLNSVCLSFSGSLILWGFFQKSTGSFQFLCNFFWLIIADFIVLTWVGQKPVRDSFILLGQFATFYYFLFFLVLIPVVGKFESKLAHYKHKNSHSSEKIK